MKIQYFSTFDAEDRLNKSLQVPIHQNTIIWLDRKTGAVKRGAGKDMLVYVFYCFLCRMFPNLFLTWDHVARSHKTTPVDRSFVGWLVGLQFFPKTALRIF